jgi:hypothetical protein
MRMIIIIIIKKRCMNFIYWRIKESFRSDMTVALYLNCIRQEVTTLELFPNT